MAYNTRDDDSNGVNQDEIRNKMELEMELEQQPLEDVVGLTTSPKHVYNSQEQANKPTDDLGSHSVVLKKKLPLLSQFSELKQNSDLNNPPPNWLVQTSEAGQYFRRQLFSQFEQPSVSPERPLSSILLASHYLDKIGHIDIIADAKNVKKLLMLPYSHSDVSMVVHKAGNTLLIDELKPSTALLKNSLLGKLFKEGKIPELIARKKDPVLSHHRNMFSKLLYYSLQDSKGPSMLLPSPDDERKLPQGDGGSAPSPVDPTPTLDPSSIDDVLPNKDDVQQETPPTPLISTSLVPVGGASLSTVNYTESDHSDDFDRYRNASDSENKTEDGFGNEQLNNLFPSTLADPDPQPFHLNVEWTIKDIRMLLGSDLPIFGRSGRPAFSLKLRDMQKPITVLTGLDYWLDNLMCNVPELVMCFHVNGIVQKYKIIKTEELPTSLQFSPHEIQEVAQNILSFLKTNCTKEGHTYWLFHPKGEDVIKLYDLTSLEKAKSANNTGPDSNNPYAASVALLFYRVAKRMLKYGEKEQEPPSAEDLGIVKLLLENCIKLLQDDRTSRIVISSYYLLADLILRHVPSKPESQSVNAVNNSSDDWTEEGVSEGGAKGLDKKGNDKTQEVIKVKSKRKRNDSCVRMTYDDSASLSVSDLRESAIYSETTPITPPTTPLVIESNHDRARLTLTYITKGISVMLSKNEEMAEWKVEAMVKLIHLAARTYWVLAEGANDLNKLGRSLRYTRLSILCHKASSGDNDGMSEELFNAWQLAGDLHCLLTSAAGKFSSHLEDFLSHNPEDQHVYNIASSMYNFTVKEDGMLSLHKEITTTLEQSIECYEHCQKLIKKGGASSLDKSRKHTLKMRLGNSWNELGRYYKHISSTMDFSKESEQIEEAWDQSTRCFKKSLEFFDSIQNVSNQALLTANLGSIMRMCAETYPLLHQHDELVGREVSLKEESCCKDAIQYYTKGQEVLKRAKTDRSVWFSIELDLAGVHQLLAQKLQERPPLSRMDLPEIERLILSHLMKALHHAESAYSNVSVHDSQRHAHLSQFIGNCHQRLASLYHKMAASSTNSQKVKFNQAEKHYTKSLQYYQICHHQPQIIRTYLERAFIYEQESVGVKLPLQFKLLCQSLENLLAIRSVLEHMEIPKVDDSEGASRGGTSQDTEEGQSNEGSGGVVSFSSSSIGQLLAVLIQRLQTVLKQLTLASKKGHPSQVCCKQMYGIALKGTGAGPGESGGLQDQGISIDRVKNMLHQIYEIFTNLKS